MNAWNRQELEEDGLTESCDVCNRIIRNWDWMQMSFVTLDGRIVCNDCRTEMLKVVDISY